MVLVQQLSFVFKFRLPAALLVCWAAMKQNKDAGATLASAETTSVAPVHLRQGLGLVMATAVVIGTVIGSGVFKKPQSVADNVPSFAFVALVWVLGGTVALLGSLAIAEVAVIFPKAGGNYVFLREAYGPLFGFLWGWVEFWIIRTASIAALATVVMDSLHDILRAIYGLPSTQTLLEYWEERFVTIGIIAVLAWVNIRGVRWSGALQVGITAIKVASLLAILLLPFLVRGPLEQSTETSTRGFAAFSWAGLGTAMLGVQWAYHGWMNVGSVAEEIRRPQRNIPLALLGGVGCIIFLYLGANFAYHLVIPLNEMRDLKSTTVAAEFCLRLLGPIGASVAAAAVMCSAFGALNGNILAGPRVLFGMGQDHLLPQALHRVHPRYQTPTLAIIVESAWSCILVVAAGALTRYGLPVWQVTEGVSIDLNLPANKQPFDVLTDFAMFGAVIFETMAVATIFVFRRRLPTVERPYRCWGYPMTTVAYILVLTAIAVNTLLTQHTEAATAVGFVAVGAATYGLLLRRR
jgi:amino acid transporter